MRKLQESSLTTVRVSAGACGFEARIKATRKDRRSILIEVESNCESVEELGFVLEQLGALEIKDFMSTGEKQNRVFQLASDALPHSACPVPVAIIKAAEVELDLNIPCPVFIEFESPAEKGALVRNHFEEEVGDDSPHVSV
jgi:hypothetical protein